MSYLQPAWGLGVRQAFFVINEPDQPGPAARSGESAFLCYLLSVACAPGKQSWHTDSRLTVNLLLHRFYQLSGDECFDVDDRWFPPGES